MYNIGDKVWHASRESTQERVICPECFGKKYLTVILGDDSRVTIDCAGCASGYDPPRGYVTYYKQFVNVSQVVINKVEVTRDYVEYGSSKGECNYRIGRDTDFFSTKKEAEIRATELAEKWNKEELEKIHRKEKNNRTWSWHVHYYRSQIRGAKKTIERAKEKLDAAKLHTKEKQ